MTTTLTITSGQASLTAQNYKILPSPGTAVPDELVGAILAAAALAGVVVSSSAGIGAVTVPARRFVGTGTGSPSSGSWLLGDELVDSTGAEYECIGAGSPGTWVAASGGGGAVSSVAGRTGAVTLTKADVGLGNVGNTADAAKPMSTAATAVQAATIGAGVYAAGVYPARPSGFATVQWIGPSSPAGAIDGDLWINTT